MGRNSEDVAHKRDDDHDPAPRCSTPMFDPCVGSRRGTGALFAVPDEEGKAETGLSAGKRNDRGLYREWKLYLQRGRARAFKVRGVRNRGPTKNCSIISGHFEPEVVVPCPSGDAPSTPSTPPTYQMWFPFDHPRLWTPAHDCRHPQNQLWFHPLPQYHRPPTPQCFTPAQCFFFANLCHQGYRQTAQFTHCNCNYYHANPYPPHEVHRTPHHHHQHQLFNIPTPFPNPACHQPPHFFLHGTNAVAFPHGFVKLPPGINCQLPSY